MKINNSKTKHLLKMYKIIKMDKNNFKIKSL